MIGDPLVASSAGNPPSRMYCSRFGLLFICEHSAPNKCKHPSSHSSEIQLREKCIMLQGVVCLSASTKLDIRQPKERLLCKGRAPLIRGWQRQREHHIGPDIEHRLRGWAPLGTTVCAIVGEYGIIENSNCWDMASQIIVRIAVR